MLFLFDLFIRILLELLFFTLVPILHLLFTTLRITTWICTSFLDHLFFPITNNPRFTIPLVGLCLFFKLGQPWHQTLSTIKSLLIFTSNGLYQVSLSLLTWFWNLFTRATSFQFRWGCLGKKEVVPNIIRLKLAVDKESNRVLFAESDKDFLDILFSFLTLPLGTIVRLAEKKSRIGCMDNLYESIEILDDKFLQTKACKTMLLNPKNAYGIICKNLVVKIDDTDPTKHYICSKFFCSTQEENVHTPSRLASEVKDSECICGRVMDKEVFLDYLSEGISDRKSVFTKEAWSFIITDDLCITPTSISGSHKVLQNLKVDNGKNIEERIVTVGKEEILQLLKNSFVSKTPMTNTFLVNEQDVENNVPGFETRNKDVNIQMLTNSIRPGKRLAKMKVKLLIDKPSNRVLCLEADDDFLDIVLSFLTFPLGFILKILRGHCSLGSMDGLYTSVNRLDEKKYLNFSIYKGFLLNPNLAPNFGCEDQVLMIGEETPTRFTGFRCNNSLCLCSWHKKLTIMNPKLPGQVMKGGGFVKKQTPLLIYDDLVIKPLSPTSGINDLYRNNVRISDTEVREVEVGGEEVLALLMASLTSKSVLSSVFSWQRN